MPTSNQTSASSQSDATTSDSWRDHRASQKAFFKALNAKEAPHTTQWNVARTISVTVIALLPFLYVAAKHGNSVAALGDAQVNLQAASDYVDPAEPLAPSKPPVAEQLHDTAVAARYVAVASWAILVWCLSARRTSGRLSREAVRATLHKTLDEAGFSPQLDFAEEEAQNVDWREVTNKDGGNLFDFIRANEASLLKCGK